MMEDDLKENITTKETWLRGLFILLFGFLLAVGRVVLWATVVVQFLFTLFSGRANEKLLKFSGGLCRFLYQCFLYITFNVDEKPFPFDEWPSVEIDEGAGKGESKKRVTKKSAAKKTAKKKTAAKKTESGTTGQASNPDSGAASTDSDNSESAQGEGGEASASEKPEN